MRYLHISYARASESERFQLSRTQLRPNPYSFDCESAAETHTQLGEFSFQIVCTVGHKSHDPCFHKKYMEASVMTFVVHCTDVLHCVTVRVQ